MNDYARNRMRDRAMRDNRRDYRERDYMDDNNYSRDYNSNYDDRDYDYDDYDYGYEHDMRRSRDRGMGRERETYVRTDLARRRSARTGRYIQDREMQRPTYDYAMDYAMHEKRLSRSDMEKWEKELVNNDGSKGKHFTKEQIEQVAPNVGINIERYGKEEFCMAMNMMYSDYCETAKKFGVNRPEFYACLAKDFLDDKDFDGEGKEKLMLYYKCVVEKED